MDLITEFDGEDILPRQKPKYARQLAMVDAETCAMQDPPVENQTKEDWTDSYDITVTVSTTSRLYEKYMWNEEKIHRLEALIARFARMTSDLSDYAVAGIHSLDGDQMEMFNLPMHTLFYTLECTPGVYSHPNIYKSENNTGIGDICYWTIL